MKKTHWSYTCGISEKPLSGLTIGEMFEQIVAQHPTREALVSRHQNLRLTYRQLHAAVHQCARGLLSLGLQKGERLGIWAPNQAEWTIAQFATSQIGVILVNINPSYRAHELEYVLRQSGCRAVIVAAPYKTSDYPALLAEVAPRLPGLQFLIQLGTEKKGATHLWDELMTLGNGIGEADLMARQRQQQFDDPINIQYTSGTTGFPKGATLSHHNILNNGYFVAELMGFTANDRLVIPVPLYHCFGMVMGNLGCLTHGATMIYPSATFDPQAVLEAVQEERATALYGVPTMFIAELERADFARYDLTSLRTGIMAGAPCPVEVMKNVNSLMHMRDVEICYGMTETSPVSLQTRPDAPLDKRVGTVGQIHPHVEVKIIDPATGRLLPVGEKGELCTRGYSVMLGYWQNEEATRQSIDAARWMHTGDLAVMDEEGYVTIAGRIKDMVIRGGENIYPREIEEFLYTHPKIADVQVIGVPDDKYGEELMAWVKSRAGAELTAHEIKIFCHGKIAHYKVPRYIKFVDDFPMTVTGKIQKFLMREQSIRELGLAPPTSEK